MSKPVVWTKARRTWLRSRGLDTQGKVGRYFQHLMAGILECELVPHGHPERADFFSNDLQIRVESKSRGDVNALEIRTHQVREYYEEEPPFPLEWSLYSLAYYQSTAPIKAGDPTPRGFSPKTRQRSLLRNIKTELELHRFLSANTRVIFLLDLRIVQGLENHLGARPCRMVGRSEETAIYVARTKITELFGEDANFARGLRTLGLSPSGWAKAVYPMHVNCEIDGQSHPTRFTLVTVLRKSLNARVAQVIANKTLSQV